MIVVPMEIVAFKLVSEVTLNLGEIPILSVCVITVIGKKRFLYWTPA